MWSFPIFQLPQVLATDSSQLLPSLDNCSQSNRNHSVWVVMYPHACMPGSLEPVTDLRRGNKRPGSSPQGGQFCYAISQLTMQSGQSRPLVETSHVLI